MKRIYSTLMTLAMMMTALSLTACSSGSDDNESKGSTSPSSGIGISRTLHLDKAGSLSTLLPKSEADKVVNLKLSGHMDARDFDYIKWDCMGVEVVDLSDVVIDSYTGVEGTMEGKNVSYANNEIPYGAFFYWSDAHKYVYDGMPKDEGMASLKKIVLPQGIKAIRRNAFARAYNLTEINIPEGVEAIDYVAFAICNSLEELRLPSTLKRIGELAFADMNKMERLYVSATTPPTATNNSFQGITDATLYVPSGTENKYRNANGWKSFNKIESINGGNNGEGSSSNNTFTITVDGNKHEYSGEYLDYMKLMGTWESYSGVNYLKINIPSMSNEFRMYFTPNTNPSSYFKVGYSSFVDDATEICLYSSSKNKCTHVGGSAKVINNDGRNLTVQFSNFAFTWKSGNREIAYDGTLNFALSY